MHTIKITPNLRQIYQIAELNRKNRFGSEKESNRNFFLPELECSSSEIQWHQLDHMQCTKSAPHSRQITTSTPHRSSICPSVHALILLVGRQEEHPAYKD